MPAPGNPTKPGSPGAPVFPWGVRQMRGQTRSSFTGSKVFTRRVVAVPPYLITFVPESWRSMDPFGALVAPVPLQEDPVGGLREPDTPQTSGLSLDSNHTATCNSWIQLNLSSLYSFKTTLYLLYCPKLKDQSHDTYVVVVTSRSWNWPWALEDPCLETQGILASLVALLDPKHTNTKTESTELMWRDINNQTLSNQQQHKPAANRGLWGLKDQVYPNASDPQREPVVEMPPKQRRDIWVWRIL